MRRSLRWRLAWTFTLLATFTVLIHAVALFVATEEREEDLIDEVINTALDETLRRPSAFAATPEAGSLSPRLKLYRLNAGQQPPPLPAAFATLHAGNYEWYGEDTEYHVGIRDNAGERLYLLYDATEHQKRLDYLLWRLVCGLAVLSALSLWLGYWLAGRMLLQLAKITQRLAGDDTAVVNDPSFDREVALLADALDDYRQRNRELLAREREFTANVSHELRTPLTGIRTGAELFVEDAALPARWKERAQRIVKAVDDMESRLRGLLFLARELAPHERRAVALQPCAQLCAAHYAPACAAAGVALEIDIPHHTTVNADPALLQLLLENLIGNAARYTRQGKITISWRDGVLTVADTGIGITPEQLTQVFRRHYRASDVPGGFGLGLSIVQRICDAHGWQCVIGSIATDSDPRRGTQVTVTFAPAGEKNITKAH